jgi:hypothetical protein
VLHYIFVIKNVTISLDEEVAHRARVMAAEQKTSVSRLVGEMLREKMIDEQNYQIAMQQYLSRSSTLTSAEKIIDITCWM